MIAHVAGRVAALAPDSAVVEVGGVGLSVQCTPSTLAGLRVGEPALLPTEGSPLTDVLAELHRASEATLFAS